jgi:hypothetical protein
MSSGMLERMRGVCRVRPVCRVTIHRWVEDPTVYVARLTTAGRHKIKVNARRWADLRDSLTGVTLRNTGGHLAIPGCSWRVQKS